LRQGKGLRMEQEVRLGSFLVMLLVMASWEVLAPRRSFSASRPRRWASNLGIVVLNAVVLRLVFPAATVGIAVAAQTRGWGLFNNVSMSAGLTLLLAVALLDFVIYLQHVMFHAVPLFWRFHRMHHTDLDLDVTSGLRFHPAEMILSMVVKACAVVLIGPSPTAIIVFEVVLNVTAMFNHGNAYIPAGIDRVLRWFVVTPDMHRVHHSVIPKETDSNFGFNIPWWDRLCGTYRAQPREGHEAMTIGLSEYQDERPLKFLWLLVSPFIGQTS
jgi:sterol desaturase/sphingolipid hydroxylase (fatty acid hydroxylase superfamily)